MSDPFLSSDGYAERAHQLYNSGSYDEALEVLRDGLAIYPASVELHVGLAYARLAREEYAWARAAFEEALALDPTDEDGLAGLGETLLKFGERDRALKLFEKVVVLGFTEDHDLMLQIARALFRENDFEHAQRFFAMAADAHPQSSEACAGLGYSAHRLGDETKALKLLRHALELEPEHAEARVYLGNVLYDRGEYEAALFHYEQTDPTSHFDELALWRLIELKKSIYKLPDADPELTPWVERLGELADFGDSVDKVLADIEALRADGTVFDPSQLDLFGALLMELTHMRGAASAESHKVKMHDGRTYSGTWEEIVLLMSRDNPATRGSSLVEYMERVAKLNQDKRGVVIPATNAAAFVQASAAAGLLMILR
ncbi:MAG: tetratricopeptide repeat protein [Gemmatimonadales bacterium]